MRDCDSGQWICAVDGGPSQLPEREERGQGEDGATPGTPGDTEQDR